MLHNLFMKITFLFILLSIGIVSWGFSEKPEFKPVPDKKGLENMLNKVSENTDTVSSDFIQKKHLGFLDAVIESKGKFLFKKGAFLRWEYVEPYHYAMILNKGTFYIKDGEKSSEFDIKSNPVFQNVIELMYTIVQGKLVVDGDYSIEAFQSPARFLVKIFPREKKMKGVLQQVNMYFNKKDLGIQKIEMVENKEDYTEIVFTNRKVNEPIPDAIFSVM